MKLAILNDSAIAVVAIQYVDTGVIADIDEFEDVAPLPRTVIAAVLRDLADNLEREGEEVGGLAA